MYVAEKKLIYPLMEHCREMLPNSFAVLLLEELLICKGAIDNHRNLRNVSVEEFYMYSNQLDNIYNDLNNSLKELKETQRY